MEAFSCGVHDVPLTAIFQALVDIFRNATEELHSVAT
jgi:hypothetical protein